MKKTIANLFAAAFFLFTFWVIRNLAFGGLLGGQIGLVTLLVSTVKGVYLHGVVAGMSLVLALLFVYQAVESFTRLVLTPRRLKRLRVKWGWLIFPDELKRRMERK